MSTNDGVPLFSIAHPVPYWTYKPTRYGKSPWRQGIRLESTELVTITVVSARDVLRGVGLWS